MAWPNLRLTLVAPLLVFAASVAASRTSNTIQAPRREGVKVEQTAFAERPNPAVPCAEGEDNRKSDLCASWKAADAASEAATWAFWQMMLSALGLFGLLVTLYYTRQATRAAAAANAGAAESLATAKIDADAAVALVGISQDNAERELRAYLEIQSLEFAGHAGKVDPGKKKFRLRVNITNYGRTPASEIEARFTIFYVRAIGEERSKICSDTGKIGNIAPTDNCFFNCFISLDNELAEQINIGDRFVEVSLAVMYKDVFSKNRETRSEFEGEDLLGFGAIEGSRFFS